MKDTKNIKNSIKESIKELSMLSKEEFLEAISEPTEITNILIEGNFIDSFEYECDSDDLLESIPVAVFDVDDSIQQVYKSTVVGEEDVLVSSSPLLDTTLTDVFNKYEEYQIEELVAFDLSSASNSLESRLSETFRREISSEDIYIVSGNDEEDELCLVA